MVSKDRKVACQKVRNTAKMVSALDSVKASLKQWIKRTDRFDGEQFQNRAVWSQLFCDAKIQLKEAIHGYRNTE
jgi:hypothetical protein